MTAAPCAAAASRGCVAACSALRRLRHPAGARHLAGPAPALERGADRRRSTQRIALPRPCRSPRSRRVRKRPATSTTCRSTATGTFLHDGERHFFATWKGQSGFFVYTPLRLADGRFVFVNRGFVPYDLKDAGDAAAGPGGGRGHRHRPGAQSAGRQSRPRWCRTTIRRRTSSTGRIATPWRRAPACAPRAEIVPFFIDADADAQSRRLAGRRRDA